MIEVAGRADDQAVRDVAAAVVVGDLRHGRAGDHLGLAEDAAAERMIAVDGLGEEVVHAVLRLVLVHRDLLEHDLALGVDVGERRAEHHLGHQVERVLGVLVEEAGVDVRGLLGGRGVRRGPHAVHLLGDLDRREALGALEEQVLEEVRKPFLALAASSREPVLTQSPRATDRTEGTTSVTTRTPLGSVVSWTFSGREGNGATCCETP